MTTTERVVLWATLVLVLISLIIGGIILAELAEVNRNLVLVSGGDLSLIDGDPLDGPEPLPTPATPADSGGAPWGGEATNIAIAGVRVYSDAVAMTVTVKAYGAGDLLYEPPLLGSEEGDTYPVSADSLEAARLEFLNLVTRGEATAGLVFVGRLAPTEGLWLVFNPSQEPTSVVAPPLQVPVPIQTGVVVGGEEEAEQ